MMYAWLEAYWDIDREILMSGELFTESGSLESVCRSSEGVDVLIVWEIHE